MFVNVRPYRRSNYRNTWYFDVLKANVLMNMGKLYNAPHPFDDRWLVSDEDMVDALQHRYHRVVSTMLSSAEDCLPDQHCEKTEVGFSRSIAKKKWLFSPSPLLDQICFNLENRFLYRVGRLFVYKKLVKRCQPIHSS